MVEWKLNFGAKPSQAASGFSIYVPLPRQRSERDKVVVSRLGLHPGQAIAAPDPAGRTHTQWAVAIVDADLRQDPEQEAAHWRWSVHQRGDQGNEPAHPPR